MPHPEDTMTPARFHQILRKHRDYEIHMYVGRLRVKVMRVGLLRQVYRHKEKNTKCLDLSVEFDHDRKCMDIFHGLE